MRNALLFDAYGNSVPPGAQSLDALDLRAWPGCRMISEGPDADLGCIIILADDSDDLPPEATAHAVAVLEAGESVVIHARTDEMASAGAESVMMWLGGTLQ
jgi:hypothetical protein